MESYIVVETQLWIFSFSDEINGHTKHFAIVFHRAATRQLTDSIIDFIIYMSNQLNADLGRKLDDPRFSAAHVDLRYFDSEGKKITPA